MLRILVVNIGVQDSVQSDHRQLIDPSRVYLGLAKDLAYNLQELVERIKHEQ